MKGGINFEEWKEIVKKNRRSLRSKSNIYRFEPESLTYGAEKAVKSPEYGQVYTITYNVTGMEVPSDWPTEIKSGKTISLSTPEGHIISSVDVNADYEQDGDSITIDNIQKDLSITFTVSPINTNGHEYVDLGLPSGTLWATMNVGATSPTEYGNYYMYGMGSKTYDSTDTPYAGEEDPLATSADTAAQVWGGQWHMPTKTQCEELITNTTYQWVTDYLDSGINGYLFTSTNSNYIFIPCFSNSGYGLRMFQSWTSTPSYMFGGNDGSTPGVISNNRTNRAHVRPVVG